MPSDNELRRLPLAKRAFSDRRTLVLTLATMLAALVIFAAAKLWFPLLDKAFEWFWGIFAALLGLAEVTTLVHNFRRRRRWHPPVPKPLAALTHNERIAAQLISEIVLDFPHEVAEGRAKGDLKDRLRPHIDLACAQFFLLVGETQETLAAFQSQLARIVGGGESRLTEGYMPPKGAPA